MEEKAKVRLYLNGEEEIVELRERKGRMEMVLKSGKVVVTENRHLFEMLRRRMNDRS